MQDRKMVNLLFSCLTFSCPLDWMAETMIKAHKGSKTMKKRIFLKTSSAALTGAALSNMSGCKGVDTSVAPPSGQAAARLKNWAGNLEYSTGNVAYPESVEQAQGVVTKANKIRAVGSQHCFNKIADSP